MSLLSLRQSLIDTFELRVLLDLGDGAVERRAVAFVLPVGHVLGHFVGVSHPSPPKMCGSGPLLLPPNQPSAAEPQPNSEYLPQRRKGRKEIKLPDLAFLASFREQIPVLDSYGPPENLRKPRELSTIIIYMETSSSLYMQSQPLAANLISFLSRLTPLLNC